MPGKRAPTLTDVVLGRQIRSYRLARGMALRQLSQHIGVSNPQLHRYECGRTRVTIGRLIDIAAALGVSVEMLVRVPVQVGAAEGGVGPRRSGEVRLLLDAFNRIGDDAQCRALVALARSMAADPLL